MLRDEATAGLVRKLWGAIDPQCRQALELTEAEETHLIRLLPTDEVRKWWMARVKPVPEEDQPWVNSLVDNALKNLRRLYGRRREAPPEQSPTE